MGNTLVSTCRLLRPAGDSFYSDGEAALLPEEEYREAFRRTVVYMSGVLGWGVVPDMGDSCRENTGACPV